MRHAAGAREITIMIELLLLFGIIEYANAHGMLYYAGPMPSQDSKGAVRDYDFVDHQIDKLRNPIDYPKLCRGAAPRPPIPIHLSKDEDFEVTFAFSVGAQHVGPCTIEILDADDLSKPGVVIASAPSEAGCAVKPIAQFNTDKASPATNQCPGKVPAGLVTNVSQIIY
jgi:hypothetical protein